MSWFQSEVQKLAKIFKAFGADPIQLSAFNSGLRHAAHPLFLAFSDEFRLWLVFIRLGVSIAFVEDIRAIVLCESCPTSLAVIVIPFLAWDAILNQSKRLPPQVIESIKTPVIPIDFHKISFPL